MSITAHIKIYLFLTFILSGCATAPTSRPFDEEKEGYTILASQRANDEVTAQEVSIFFFYACPHCYNLYVDHLKQWALEASPAVKVSFVPVNWNPKFTSLARAYHAGELAGINPSFHESLFLAFHQNPQLEKTKESFAAVAENCCGIARQKFIDIYDSVETDRRLAESDTKWKKHKIAGTPSAVVNGKYFVSPVTAKSNHNMMRAIDGLLKGKLDSSK